MSRDWRMYLDDIVVACAKVQKYADGMSRREFDADDRTKDAVIRNLEIIGEAAKHVPDDIRNALSEVDWHKIRAFRNILAHAYFGIDSDVLWDVVTVKVPELHAAIHNWIDRTNP